MHEAESLVLEEAGYKGNVKGWNKSFLDLFTPCCMAVTWLQEKKSKQILFSRKSKAKKSKKTQSYLKCQPTGLKGQFGQN